MRLLTDLRDHVFCGADRMPTAAILEVLLSLDESPWDDMSEDGQSAKPLTSRGLATLLSQYVKPDDTPIKPKGIRVGSSTPKGYYAEDLQDAWNRYCPRTPRGPQHPQRPQHRRSTRVNLWRIPPPRPATCSPNPTHANSASPAEQRALMGPAAPSRGGTYPQQKRHPPQIHPR